MRRACIVNGRPNRFEIDPYALRKPSRCPEHRGRAWAGQSASRQAAYIDPTYRRNRKIAIEREPECHWRFPGCTRISTTADHVLSVAQGGGHELENLVGSCARCNHRRGSAAGGATAKQRRAAAKKRRK